MLFNILALISTIIIITLLRRMVNIFPSLVSCIYRWKESVNLETSVKNSYDRNIIAVGMVIPFCLIVEKFNLYSLSFMEGMDEDLKTGIIIGIFLAYIIIRKLASLMVMTKKSKKKVFDTAHKSAFTFFILLTLLLLATGGILSLIDVEAAFIRNAMLWISVSIYAIFIIRKTQIFASSFSILTSFLYLCALEIFPTGILVVPVLIF